MPDGGATMSSIISTICAYFHTHHGNETRTYFVKKIHFTYVQKQRSKKHVPWKAPLMRYLSLFIHAVYCVTCRCLYTQCIALSVAFYTCSVLIDLSLFIHAAYCVTCCFVYMQHNANNHLDIIYYRLYIWLSHRCQHYRFRAVNPAFPRFS